MPLSAAVEMPQPRRQTCTTSATAAFGSKMTSVSTSVPLSTCLEVSTLVTMPSRRPQDARIVDARSAASVDLRSEGHCSSRAAVRRMPLHGSRRSAEVQMAKARSSCSIFLRWRTSRQTR